MDLDKAIDLVRKEQARHEKARAEHEARIAECQARIAEQETRFSTHLEQHGKRMNRLELMVASQQQNEIVALAVVQRTQQGQISRLLSMHETFLTELKTLKQTVDNLVRIRGNGRRGNGGRRKN